MKGMRQDGLHFEVRSTLQKQGLIYNYHDHSLLWLDACLFNLSDDIYEMQACLEENGDENKEK